VGRLGGTADATETPIGRVPTKDALDTQGLSLSDEAIELLLSVDTEAWRGEAALIPDHYERFGDRLPPQLWDEHRALVERLGGS
jgi:phosphoenolpyruvate carboxykinase (GTP)